MTSFKVCRYSGTSTVRTARSRISDGFGNVPLTRGSRIAEHLLFLAGDRSANITGTDLVIDGGFVPTW
ncbi:MULTISPECIES: hypothetical protein [unclassified Nonomuraea]|uniref:hypothetical protein n=1 Tax=unclassified Nonomuraea TaxID=2593643 RepID=UPI0033F81811